MNKKLLSFVILVILFGGSYFAFSHATRPLTPPSAMPAAAQAPEPVAESVPEGKIRFRIVEGTQARFSLGEDLRGVRTHVLGTTPNVEGSVFLDEADASDSIIGTIRVNARTFVTDDEKRNAAIGRFILESEKPGNEFIEFAPTAVAGLPAVLETGVEYPIVIDGELTIKGITKPVSFNATVAHNERLLTGWAVTVVRYADFGISIPNLPFLANVDEEVELRIDLAAEQA